METYISTLTEKLGTRNAVDKVILSYLISIVLIVLKLT
jgi:hypothetical protein